MRHEPTAQGDRALLVSRSNGGSFLPLRPWQSSRWRDPSESPRGPYRKRVHSGRGDRQGGNALYLQRRLEYCSSSCPWLLETRSRGSRKRPPNLRAALGPLEKLFRGSCWWLLSLAVPEEGCEMSNRATLPGGRMPVLEVCQRDV